VSAPAGAPEAAPATPSASAPAPRIEGPSAAARRDAGYDPRRLGRPLDDPSAAMLATHPIGGNVEFKPGNGLRFRSEDGLFQLSTWLRAQLRQSVEGLESPEPDAPVQGVLSFPRASLFFSGHAFGVHNKGFVQLNFGRGPLGGAPGPVTQSPLFDFFFRFDHVRDLNVQIGQFKPYVNRQWIGSWGGLAFVERARVQEEFRGERDVGIDLHSLDVGGLGRLRYHAGVFHGAGRTPTESRPFHLLYTARFEVLPLGLFDSYDDVDFDRSPTPKLALGLGYSFHDDAPRSRGVRGPAPADGGTTDLHTAAFDAVLRVRGFELATEAYWRDGLRNPGDAVDESGAPIPTDAVADGVGGFVQLGGILPTLPLTIYARWGQQWTLDDSSLVDGGELGGAIGYFLVQHLFKIQLDYTHGWGGLRATAPRDGGDFLAGDGALQLQLQMSL
jgi:hypothetical protein